MSKFWLMVIVLPVMISCSKYEEGSFFSLKTKESRIIGKWELVHFNDESEIVEYYDLFKQYWQDCGQEYTTHKTIIIKEDLIWEFDSYSNMREKYIRTGRKLDFDQSYLNPDCIPVYNDVGSAEIEDDKSWELSKKKYDLRIIEGETITEYEIIKLSNSEMKLENDYGDIYFFTKL